MKEDIEYLIKMDLRPWSRIDGKLPEMAAYLALAGSAAAVRTLLSENAGNALTKYFVIIPLLAIPIVVSSYVKKQWGEYIAKFLTDSVYMAVLSSFILLVLVSAFQNEIRVWTNDSQLGRRYIYALLCLASCAVAYAYGIAVTMRKVHVERTRYGAEYGGHKREPAPLLLIIGSEILVTYVIMVVLIVLKLG
jgi:hypothetical protein